MELEQFVNESGAAATALWCADFGRFVPHWQPLAALKHRPHMSFTRVSLAMLAATLCWTVSAQSAVPAAPAAASVSGTLRPALAQVSQSLNGISIRRWKAPNDVKSAADQDVSSIQRDLSGTLATLMGQADAAPGSVPAAFAVYRNVDALYDTLLRVVLTANLAASDTEVNSLQAALSTLESARGSLADSILNASQAQTAELAKIRTALARAAVVQKAPATTTVVDDGPATSVSKSKHTPAKKPASKPANSNNGSSSPQ
ncbi:MAG: hypothetical protein WCC27_19660 [Acidobacteriaceae bacterium]